jgi:hypothetical protein
MMVVTRATPEEQKGKPKSALCNVKASKPAHVKLKLTSLQLCFFLLF